MKKTITLLFIGFASVFFMADAYAQTVTIDADFRSRFENRHGYKTIFPKDAKGANFISQRSRLKLSYGAEKFKLGFSLQNVGVWGENGQLTKSNVNGTMVHEAWGEILFSEKFSLKAGRQEIIYDDHRIFGSVDWTMQGRSHDAAIFKLKPNDKHKIDIGLAYNAMGESLYRTDYMNKNYKAFQLVHWHGNFDALGVSFLFLNNGIAYNSFESVDTAGIAKTTEKIVYSQTIGPRFTYKKDKLKANAAFYYQMGNVKTGGGTAGADSTMGFGATYFEIDASYAINDNFSIGAGVEYLSGNDGKEIADNNGVQDKQKAFAPLYGTNHKFNGWMDYFYVGNHFNSYGLMDIFIPIKYKKDKFSAALIPHIFSTAGTLYAPEKDENFVDKAEMKEYSKGLGTEIDIVLGYTVTKGMAVKAGYSMMFASETMEVLKGTQVDAGNTWAWVMLVFKPNFYTSK
ncbi:MAG: hypothetical protein DRJ05_10630 [Bacteroidetes bacterium]|nr:MAG: hypothetical protein DRJ05_10630 [Bacteroidota bacterium]